MTIFASGRSGTVTYLLVLFDFFDLTDKIVWISAAILVWLFMVQRFGTHKVGYSFAPIICIWFILIGGIGFYNFIKFDPSVIKAVNPKYIFHYFKRNKMDAWISLGGVVLAITGSIFSKLREIPRRLGRRTKHSS